MNDNEFETPEDLRELECELAKFRPKKPTPNPLGLYRNLKSAPSTSLASRLATLAAGLLIGAVIGGAGVYFALGPGSSETIVVQIDPEPTGTPTHKSSPERGPAVKEDFALNTHKTGILDDGPAGKIDLLIADVNERSMRLSFAGSRVDSSAARYRYPESSPEIVRRPKDLLDEFLLQ